MARSFVDLSITLCNDVVSDPPFMRPHIDYAAHRDTMAELGHFFPGVTPEIIQENTGFEIDCSRAETFEAPPAEIIRLIREEIDPGQAFIKVPKEK